ncbi:DUF4189 domain-containing protein [Nocardia sp. SYP-A9097]|uniref:DUF4189 domain-containing protein n=1 Tax=Nocardia sp. SYP-A9097 TaxID=2663237 RepID=UPI001891240D|nr:DUF4189 domain-containing protein [Nocardia sp. SYP-A9097]
MIAKLRISKMGSNQMSLSRQTAFAGALSVIAALTMVGAGTANAEGDVYGAIAISKNAVGQLDKHGWASNYPDAAAAEAAALDACGQSKCVVVLTFQNTCAALVKRQGTPAGWAIGPDQVTAEKNAFSSLGPDDPIGSLGGMMESGQVVRSGCTPNAR